MIAWKKAVAVFSASVMMFSSVSIAVDTESLAKTKTSSKTAKVSLAKKRLALTVTQNAGKKKYSTAKIKVKKKKGVKIKSIKYTCNDTEIAKVNKSGKVTARHMGATKITVKVKYRYKKKTTTKNLTCKVRVTNKYKNIFQDMKLKHKVYATFVGNSESVIPCYKSDVKLDKDFLAWDCLKMDVADASVVMSGKNGYIRGLKPGETTLTLRSTDGTGLVDTATVKVYASAAEVPPADDLYESEKDEFLAMLEGTWTEEEKKRFIDKEGHVKWDYFSQADMQYETNMSKLIDEYMKGAVDEHPDGSSEDALLSLLSTYEDMTDKSDADEVFFKTLNEKIATPILEAKTAGELVDICSSMGHDGLKAFLDTDEFVQEQENADTFRAVFDGEKRATDEDICVDYHYYAKLEGDVFGDLLFLEKPNKKIRAYVRDTFEYLGIKDSDIIEKTQDYIISTLNKAKKNPSFQAFKSLKELNEEYPNIGIKKWMEKLQFNVSDNSLIAYSGVAAIKELNQALGSGDDLAALKGYAILTAIKELIPYTKKGLRTSLTLFAPDRLEGKSEKEIKKEIEGQLKNNLSEAYKTIPFDTDQVYTNRFYSKTYKKSFEQMAERFRDTYVKVIGGCDMSEKARASALKKVKSMRLNCLYPTAKEYDRLTVQDDMKTSEEGGNLAENLLAVMRYRAHLSRITVESHPGDTNWWAPIDKFFDNLIPWENNAMHMFAMNRCVFTHVLVAPIFEDNPTGSKEIDVKNIAYMATTIGHEIGHGFDGTGCNFDENGHIRSGWEKNDFDIFDEKSNKIAELYGCISSFQSDSEKTSLYQDGNSVKNEAIADLGGTEIALRLLEDTYPGNDDYVRDFFKMTARQWVDSYKDYSTADELKEAVQDEHPTTKARTNGVAMCMDEFYRVFDVKEGDAMYLAPEDRVRLWNVINFK